MKTKNIFLLSAVIVLVAQSVIQAQVMGVVTMSSEESWWLTLMCYIVVVLTTTAWLGAYSVQLAKKINEVELF